MAFDFHRDRINAAFFRANEIRNPEDRLKALTDLSQRLDGIVQRAAKRDDDSIKAYARDHNGSHRSSNPFTPHNQILAQNNFIISKIQDASKRAAKLAGSDAQSFIPA